jgi:hypothetical protein
LAAGGISNNNVLSLKKHQFQNYMNPSMVEVPELGGMEEEKYEGLELSGALALGA